MSAYDHNLDIIFQIIEAIQEVAIPKFGLSSPNEVVAKNKVDWDDPLTTTDINLQEAIVHRLGWVCGPLGAVVSEELGSSYGRLLTGKPTIESCQIKLHRCRKGIVIDPIDGTKRFRDGKEGWAVMISMFEDNGFTAAWIVKPTFASDKIGYEVVSAGRLGENWTGHYTTWVPGRSFPITSKVLRPTDTNTSKVVTIQESAFTDEYREAADIFYEILKDNGCQLQIAYSSNSADNYGTAALDWAALAKGEIGGLLISSAPFYDEMAGALISLAIDNRVTTIKGESYLNPRLWLPNMQHGVMSACGAIMPIMEDAAEVAFGDLFRRDVPCTLQRRLLPSGRQEAARQILTP